ncbi:MAG: 3-oxoadipate enol-lactonase 2 [Ignavibacteriaceae bacterium]|nr:3-oxoadipate enol-lactonase 2 [Ignavibacteriaceae bacterium]
MNMIRGLSVRTYGNLKHQPLVFLHGFPLSQSMWNKQIQEFEQDYYCVTPDFRGLGESVPSTGLHTMEGFADDILFLIETLDLHKPVLCGLSMGGYAALRIAERAPEVFSGLILCDTKSSSDPDEVKLKRAAAIKRIQQDGAEGYIREFVHGIFYPSFLENHFAEFDRYVAQWVKNPPEGVIGALLAMMGRTDTTEALKNFTFPVLCICGAYDAMTPPSVMKDLARLAPQGEYYEVPEAGHMSPLENPEAVNNKIQEFLRRISGK